MRPAFVRPSVAVTFLFGITMTVAVSVGGQAHAADVSTFHGVSSTRLLETRTGGFTSDGESNGVGALVSNGAIDVKVVGRVFLATIGVADVAAVVLNVTATNPKGSGFLTVYPSGTARPTASNLNFVPGQTIANMVVVPVGPDGAVSIFNGSDGTTDVVVDLLGWFPVGPAFKGLTPARLLDTRPGLPTIDGQLSGGGKLAAGAVSNPTIIGRGGVPSTGVGAVALNVTVTNPTTAGFLTVFPNGQSRPNASNINFVKGQTIPNMVIVPLGADGRVSIFNGGGGTTDVVVDVLGWFPTGSAFSGLTPARLLDSRVGLTTIDGRFSGGGSITAPRNLNLTVGGRGGVPASGVGAVALNITVTNPTGAGFLSVFPQGGFPVGSSLNFVAGQTIPNMVIVPVGGHGQISIFVSSGSPDIIVDVLGWFPNPTSPPTNFGNDLVLRTNGVGTAVFGAEPASTIDLLRVVFGDPQYEVLEAFNSSFPGTNILRSLTSGDTFKYPWGRLSCFLNGPCVTFGGGTPTTMKFVGWTYSDDASRLIDENGLSIGSRGSDFPGGIATINNGVIPGCRSAGSGTATSGIRLGLLSRGQPFGTVDATDSPLFFTPSQSDVRVTDMRSGDLIGSKFSVFDCPIDFGLS